MNRSEQFDQLIAKYLDAQRRQQAPSRGQMIARHPEFAAEISSFFDNQEALIGKAPIADPAATLPPTPGADTPGSPHVVHYFGDYELLEEIARGGMGVVYKARQISLNRTVALKMILAGQFAAPADVQRFRLEAEAAANLDHANILPIYEVGEHEGQQYFSMKYVDGESLAAFIKTRTADFPDYSEKNEPALFSSAEFVKSAVQLLTAVARAVHFAHQRGIIHRDLKPGNILLDGDRTPFVADFGLAKRMEGDSKQTQTGAIVGTPTYMAPEQARSEKTLTTAVDVYALGAILYEIITGKPPFAGPTPVDVIMQVLEKEPASPSKVHSGVDKDLATIAMKCLEKDPARRYGSAEAMADDLDRWRNGEPILARPTTTLERFWKWRKREPLTFTLLSCVFVAFAGALVAAMSMVWFANQYANEAERRTASERNRVKEAEAAAEKQKTLTAEAVVAKNDAERALYTNRIALAQRYWQTDGIVQAHRVLESCPKSYRGWEWHYLRRLMSVETQELAGPALGYSATRFNRQIQFCRDRNIMMTVSHKMFSVPIWDLEKDPPKLMTTLPTPDRTRRVLAPDLDVLNRANRPTFSTAAISPDGQCVAMGESTGTVLVEFGEATGRKPIRFGNFGTAPSSLSFSPDGKRLLATGGHQLKIWDVANGQELLSRIGIVAGTYLPDGKSLLLAKRGSVLSGQMVLAICAADTGQERVELGAVLDFAWSANERQLALCSKITLTSGVLRVLELDTGKETFSTPLESLSRPTVALHPQGTHVVSRDQSKVIRVWNLQERRLAHSLRGGPLLNPVDEFRPDGRLMTIGDNECKNWDVSQAQEYECRKLAGSALWAGVVFFQQGQMFAALEMPMPKNQGMAQLSSLLGAGFITIWKVGQDKPVAKISVSSYRLATFTISECGRRIAGAGINGDLVVLDAQNGATIRTWKVGGGQVTSLCFGPDAKQVIAATAQIVDYDDKTLKPTGQRGSNSLVGWDIETGEKAWTVDVDERLVNVMADAHSGRLSTGSDRFVSVRNLADGKLMNRLEHQQKLGAFVISLGKERQSLFWGAYSDTTASVYKWDWITKTSQARLTGVPANYLAGGMHMPCAISSDGRRLASLGENGVTVSDCEYGHEIITLPMPVNGMRIMAVTFGPDDHCIHAVLFDGTRLTWDATPLPEK